MTDLEVALVVTIEAKVEAAVPVGLETTTVQQVQAAATTIVTVDLEAT